MSRILFRGKEYDSVDHNTAQVLYLVELQQQAKSLVDGGLGMRGLSALEAESRQYARDVRAWEIARAVAQEAGEPFDEPEPVVPDSSMLYAGISMFLTRRAAGEKVTLVEAMAFAPGEITLVRDPAADLVEPPDPTKPGPAGPETPTSSASA